MELAIVLVHYRTPELLRAAVEALRKDLNEEAERAEWVVIDNGNDARGEDVLRSLPITVIRPGRNLGFAGGVNLGVERTRAPQVLVANPDVLVRPGCIRALRQRLRTGASVVGPRFFWDGQCRLLLPPPERRSRIDELWSLAADWSAPWAARSRRRWRRHAWRHWRATAAVRSAHLSGALLAFEREAFEGVGPFDEGYALYFEETDWLVRLERSGRYGEYVPEAEAVHLFARSAVQEGAASDWFEASRRRFQIRHYGAWFELFCRLLARRRGRAVGNAREEVEIELPAPEVPQWVELSPGTRGFPAAAERVAGGIRRWRPPSDVRGRLEAGPYHLCVVSEDGRELAQCAVSLPPLLPPCEGVQPGATTGRES